MKLIRFMAFAAFATVLPLAAFAQTADVTYCKALAAKYRTYGKNPATDVAAALAGCDNRAGEAIPVLEKQLKDDKVALPSR